jgi:Zn-dependent alcohol dehydrogenase
MPLAAVLSQSKAPLELMELDVEPPGPGEVLVRMAAAGVCHSDLSVLQGRLVNPMPVVLGHEGAGTVEALGAGVTTLAVGDRVVLSWLAQCGECFYCQHHQASLCTTAGAAMIKATLQDGTTRFRRNGQPVYHMAGLGTFAQTCVVAEKGAVKLPDDIGFPQAALIGCGVLTGFGAAVNTGQIRVGESVAVVGCGGVGLNAIQGARIAGATQIIAIDLHDERLALARQLGATVTMKPGDKLPRDVRALTGGRGVDVAIEVVGFRETVRDAVRMTRPGGRVVLVGAGSEDVTLDVPLFGGVILTEKTIRGSLYGSSQVHIDVPRLLALYAGGQLKLDELVTETFQLKDINAAMDYCASERGARGVVVF